MTQASGRLTPTDMWGTSFSPYSPGILVRRWIVAALSRVTRRCGATPPPGPAADDSRSS